MASIQVIQGPEKGRTFELPNEECTIGRDHMTVELTDGTVSRKHARLFPRNNGWMLEDMGSANGTYLNGVKIKKPARINRGDQVRCGSTLLVFGGSSIASAVDVDEKGNLVDAAIVATIPSNEDSIVIPTPEAGAEAIGNLRFLYDLIAEVSSLFNVDTLLQRTLEKIFEIVKADRGYIMLADEKGDLTLKASLLAPDMLDDDVPISQTIINEVIAKEIGILSSNAMSDKRFAAGKSVHNFGIRSAVCAPIKGRDRILGVIHVDCSVSEHTYSTEQLRLLTAIGYQTGLVMENVRLYEAAVQSERLTAIGETVASLSHHIKNILQALTAGIDVVEMSLDRSNIEGASKAWPIVQRNIARINDLILNMLTFSKEREPHLENLNLSHVVSECVQLVAPRADEKSVAVLTDLADIPPIHADAAGLHQAIMNLLTNALEAVNDNTGIITVATAYDSMNRRVSIRVMDNGNGIDEELLDRIFEPFYSNKGQKGTGLGLAVTRKIVEEHHGRIEVDSTTPEGTTFTIILPAIEGAADSSDTDRSER